MNIKQKVLISILLSMVILTMNFIVLINSVKATNIMEFSQVDLHSGGNCGQLLKYKGVIVKTYYVEYTYNGQNYPAYCLDKSLTGVSDDLEYSVNLSNKIDDLGLWRTVINGYPYKSISELGVADKEEAFTATKQAIYCYLFENTPDDYEAIGEGGERTLNALRMIVANAQNSTETQNSSTFTIEANSTEWNEDKTNEQYVSKVYSINSIVSHLDYEISIDGKLPEGSKITKLDGTETTKFSQGEKFKIMLLKDNLNEDGEFKINVNTEVKVKPVIYGGSPNIEFQNYALTAYMYEDAVSTFEDAFTKIEKPEHYKEEPQNPKVTQPEKTIKEAKILPATGM